MTTYLMRDKATYYFLSNSKHIGDSRPGHTTPAAAFDYSVVRPVNATASQIVHAFARVDVHRRLSDAVAVLGLAASPQTCAVASNHPPTQLGHTCLGWRLPNGAELHTSWTMSVEADDDGAWLTTAVHFDADPRHPSALATAWPILGPVTNAQTKALIRAVTEAAGETDG